MGCPGFNTYDSTRPLNRSLNPRNKAVQVCTVFWFQCFLVLHLRSPGRPAVAERATAPVDEWMAAVITSVQKIICIRLY